MFCFARSTLVGLSAFLLLSGSPCGIFSATFLRCTLFSVPLFPKWEADVSFGMAIFQDSDPFTVLGIAANASQSDVKRSYRALILRNHPDKNRPELRQHFVEQSQLLNWARGECLWRITTRHLTNEEALKQNIPKKNWQGFRFLKKSKTSIMFQVPNSHIRTNL